MDFKKVAAAVVAVGLSSIAPRVAHADRRAFGFTYEYNTMPEGGVDLELWNTQSRASFPGGPANLDWKMEVEYGVTDHWDLAVYQTFGQTHGAGGSDALGYQETSLESRYRFAERGEWPVDVLVYLEVAKGFGTGLGDVEPKIILAKDLGQVSLNLNLISEIELTREASGDLELEWVPGWSFGAAYELSPQWKLGAETFGEIEDEEAIASIGPSVSWAPNEKIWVAGTVAAGLTDEASDLTARFIIGLGL